MKKLYLVTLIAFVSGCLHSQTKIIAHRGFSGIAPENTIVAFQKAIECGADYIELDVHKTIDDSLIIIHDHTVDRTSSNGIKGKVKETSYAELTKIKVGYGEKFGDKYNEEKIPTLREALMLARGKIKVCIELKVPGIEKQVLEIINEFNMTDDVVIFSFIYPALTKIRHLDKNIKTLYLVNDANAVIVDYARLISCNAIGVGYGTTVTGEFVNMVHENNIEIWKWTVNEEAEMQQLIDAGIDGLITNFPDKALKLLQH